MLTDAQYNVKNMEEKVCNDNNENKSLSEADLLVIKTLKDYLRFLIHTIHHVSNQIDNKILKASIALMIILI